MKAEKHCLTLEDVWAKLLATALAHILGESEVETPGDRLCNVKVKALTDILADSNIGRH